MIVPFQTPAGHRTRAPHESSHRDHEGRSFVWCRTSDGALRKAYLVGE